MAKTVAYKNRPLKKNDNSRWILAGVASAVVLVLALVLINLNATARPVAPPSILSAGRTLGNASAPVKIDLYSDFQCPVCRRAEQVIQQLAAQYIDSGKVQVIYHNMAFIGMESEWAAQAAECANDQGKFWDYASVLFANQTGENVGAFSQTNLKQFAANMNLDTAAFNACFDSGKHSALIQQEKSDAEARGIRATPSFYVNGQFIEGLLAPAQFGALIDSMLPKP